MKNKNSNLACPACGHIINNKDLEHFECIKCGASFNVTIEDKIISRNCAVCGKKIKVKISDSGETSGGHYFKFDKKFEKEYGEYWECPKCYKPIKIKNEKEILFKVRANKNGESPHLVSQMFGGNIQRKGRNKNQK